MTSYEQILELADRQFDGSATPDEIAQLETLLADDAGAQKAYLRYALMNGQLPLSPPALGKPTIAPTEPVAAPPKVAVPSRHRQRWYVGVWMSVAASLLIAITIGIAQYAANEETPDELAQSSYDNRQPPLGMVGKLGADELGPMTLSVEQGETEFASNGGANVRVTGPGMLGVNSPQGGVLYNGAVHAKPESPESRFSVTAANLRVVDSGTEYQVAMLDDRHVRVEVLNGQVDVQSRIRLPLYYWHFDDPAEAAHSAVAAIATPMTLGEKTKRVAGIIGSGAVRFDNTPASFVQIDEGTGGEVGEGGMACSSGITLEAMFVSNWSGKPFDYDEIFRKEDGVYRILLSFQNDGDVGDYDQPEVTPGPCLSFGLHIEKQGYSELDMPLDGRDGRPTVAELTDGRPHHVVATYDSFSGRKSIYIDGELRFEHQFPVGGLILCGGQAPAVIGNMWRMQEPFAGVIDEVALYDFPLTADEISAHYVNASIGKRYFGEESGPLAAGRWRSVTLVTAGMPRIFDKQTGEPVDVLIP
ncbi:LamG domain-containing protein [Blastopirellula sp. JC732]|uniref:LamG domain-containing protein n=1 Tax=Blastopirellula sediminis TaxID=2894196 RepID=A0A9X1MK80_9BACT|nr:LamG-like jellyroll fold domain-containing protein [Blastopirellula sediminis]MCC9609438.1 LamG domain-containing protein [Blastopirellula sediminis]MCC9627785.1 LamG domain-containing protein [Blastopirellula sediminis]